MSLVPAVKATIKATMSGEPRTIKKYPNRRLYDTAISSYITLEDVKHLVMDCTPFRVIDARSSDDITRSILLQIISEQEEQGNPIFTTEVLAHIIRFYGDTLQGMMGSYLEKSLQSFVDQQHLLRDQMRNFMGKTPLSVMSELAERNLDMWQAMTERLYQQHEESYESNKDPEKDKAGKSPKIQADDNPDKPKKK